MTRFEILVSLNCQKQNILGYSKRGQLCFFYCIIIMGTHFNNEKYKKVIFIFFCIDYIRKYFLISVKSAVFGGEKKNYNSFVLGRKCFICSSSVYYYGPHARWTIQKCQVENKRVVGFFSLGVFISSIQKMVPRISLDML